VTAKIFAAIAIVAAVLSMGVTCPPYDGKATPIHLEWGDDTNDPAEFTLIDWCIDGSTTQDGELMTGVAPLYYACGSHVPPTVHEFDIPTGLGPHYFRVHGEYRDAGGHVVPGAQTEEASCDFEATISGCNVVYSCQGQRPAVPTNLRVTVK
jgi:hypothetical protein